MNAGWTQKELAETKSNLFSNKNRVFSYFGHNIIACLCHSANLAIHIHLEIFSNINDIIISECSNQFNSRSVCNFRNKVRNIDRSLFIFINWNWIQLIGYDTFSILEEIWLRLLYSLRWLRCRLYGWLFKVFILYSPIGVFQFNFYGLLRICNIHLNGEKNTYSNMRLCVCHR